MLDVLVLRYLDQLKEPNRMFIIGYEAQAHVLVCQMDFRG